MLTTTTPRTRHKRVPSSTGRLLLTALVLSATVLTAGFAQAPVDLTADDPGAPRPGPRISSEEAVALATGVEVGENDFRISDMGGGWCDFSSSPPDVAYNSTNHEFLVVWQGDDNRGGLVDGDFEIFGQRLDAATGARLGEDNFRISDMGGTGVTGYPAILPAVAYNSTDNQYLIVWHGGDDTGGLVAGEYEIWGQRINAATGAEVGTNDFRISDMGGTGDGDFDALHADVAYNSTDNEYVVVWEGNDGSGSTAKEEIEIWGQRINAVTGAEIGVDFRISDMGGLGDAAYAGLSPAVAYNTAENEYLVVWSGDDDEGGLVHDEKEVFGQRINAATGAEIGSDFRISDMGGTGNEDFDAEQADVAYNSTDNEYLIVWYGDDDTGALVEGEYEIWGQRINAATGAEIGVDFRISDMGSDGDPNYDAGGHPLLAHHGMGVAYNTSRNEYLVVWRGDDDKGGLVDEEHEIFAQRLTAAGLETGANDFRISDVGGIGRTLFDAAGPAVTYDSVADGYLVVWHSNDDASGMDHCEYEILGQLLDASTGLEEGENDFRISFMGYERTEFAANDAAVAFNSTDHEYLVVWSGDDNSGSLADDEFEIFGQRIDATTGVELGNNDFRISHMGGTGNADFDALAPAVAYNSEDNQYLVVWHGDSFISELVDEESEIWGQRVDASGEEAGVDFRISEMGGSGDPAYNAYEAAVAYNKSAGEYLVVWHGDDDRTGLVDEEYEIFGQRIDADTSLQVGTNDFQISQMVGLGDPDYDARDPAVVYNSDDDEYVVVWEGDSTENGMVNNEFEVWGQRLDGASCSEVGPDVRVSKMGGSGSAKQGGLNPAVAYNSADSEYLVVWYGDDNVGGLVNNEYEIFGQRLNIALAALGSYFRISDMGGTGVTLYRGLFPAVAYNALENEYLVVWQGEDDAGGLVDEENEIFGQRLDAATGAEIGENDFRISDMGGTGDPAYDGYEPAVACNDTGNEYLVVWRGDDEPGELTDDEMEIFGQRISLHTAWLPLVLRKA